jgi:hypothetical protein
VDNRQAFAPSARGPGGQPEPEAEERARTRNLIDFLTAYDARRNPPVYDIRRYDLFLLREADLPGVPGVSLSPTAQAWLTVDFLDLPPRPEVPAELTGLLGETDAVSPQVRPELWTAADLGPEEGADPDEAAEPDPELMAAAEEWIAAVWEPFAARWAEVSAAKTLHRDLFQQRELLARDRESVELVWGFGRLRWEADDAVIDHPLITIPVEVEQDDATQRIRVCPAGAPEVEARCLAAVPLADRPGFISIRQSVNDEGARTCAAAAGSCHRPRGHAGQAGRNGWTDGRGRPELGPVHAPEAAGLSGVPRPHASPVPGRVGGCASDLAGDRFGRSVGPGEPGARRWRRGR